MQALRYLQRAMAKTTNTPADGSEESSETNKPSRSSSSGDGLHNYTVRLSDEDEARLKAAAEQMRRKTGGRESASSLARTFIQVGLQQFERTGGLVVSA